MTLSLRILRDLFPKDKPAFQPPFVVDRDECGEVHILDQQGDFLLTFCRYTQLPIDDDRALKMEVDYWEEEAKRIVLALNVAYLIDKKQE